MNKIFRRMSRQWMQVTLVITLLAAQLPSSVFAAEFAERGTLPEAMPLDAVQNTMPLIPSLGKDLGGTLSLTNGSESESMIRELSPERKISNAPTISRQKLVPNNSASLVKSARLSPQENPYQSPAELKSKPIKNDKRKNLALNQLWEMAKSMTQKEGVSNDWVEEMARQNAEISPEVKRLRDAAENLGFAQVALNRDVLAHHDARYTNTVPNGAITDQAKSGRCWIFAGLNAIRSTLLAEKRLPLDFEFSENYVYFFSMLEQSNRYLEDSMRVVLSQMAGEKMSLKELNKAAKSAEFRQAITPVGKFGDGGWFNWFQFLVLKYGLIPKQAMRESVSSQSSALLNGELTSSLALYAEDLINLMHQKPSKALGEKIWEAKQRALARVWKILSTHLGSPPMSFDFRQDNLSPKLKEARIVPTRITQYTPLNFAKNFVKFNAEDYVTLANYSRKKDGAVYMVRNSAIGDSKPGKPSFNHRFLQTNAGRMAELVATSIDAGHPIWFGAEMGRDVDNATGIMHPQIYDREPIYGFSPAEEKEKLSKDAATYLQVRVLNHAMAITGYDQPSSGDPIVKFRVENSWGKTAGTNGIYHMYLDWFNENVYQVIVHKKFLNTLEKKVWGGKAIKLKNWDDAL